MKPMIRMKTEMIGTTTRSRSVRRWRIPAPYVVGQPARIEMIENEMAKLEKPDQTPSLLAETARCCSSPLRSGGEEPGRLTTLGMRRNLPGGDRECGRTTRIRV